jgi:hypothetical protein
MKPITYWVQNEAIDQLVDQLGAHLEKLTPKAKRELIHYLARPDHWFWEKSSTGVEEAYKRTEHLTRHEKDLLMEAIAATLTHHGNPWVENARANVAIAQKEGTPSPRDANRH